jgi:hypothetical protein
MLSGLASVRCAYSRQTYGDPDTPTTHATFETGSK